MDETAATPPWWQTALPIGRYRFKAQALEPLVLPPFAGSLLRGQFGAALRNMSCLTGAPTCTACPQSRECHYSQIFDGTPPPAAPAQARSFSQVPNPYVLRPPPGNTRLATGSTFDIDMVLIGHSTQQLSLVAAAWQIALAGGLGPQRAKARLCEVQWLDAQDQAHKLWSAGANLQLAPHTPTLTVPPPAWHQGTIVMELFTPLRLQQQQGLIHASTLSTTVLLAALGRRIGLLLALHTGQHGLQAQGRALADLAPHLKLHSQLQWHDDTRYSARQQQEMTLGGLLGRIELHTEHSTCAHALWPWLWLGEKLHIGKNSTMGLGCYVLRTA